MSLGTCSYSVLLIQISCPSYWPMTSSIFSQWWWSWMRPKQVTCSFSLPISSHFSWTSSLSAGFRQGLTQSLGPSVASGSNVYILVYLECLREEPFSQKSSKQHAYVFGPSECLNAMRRVAFDSKKIAFCDGHVISIDMTHLFVHACFFLFFKFCL